uniref:Uncharacterized protein n=1 Tax=Parascaris univalens TaxID=6257 RepID=A0A914ZF59_PARUN
MWIKDYEQMCKGKNNILAVHTNNPPAEPKTPNTRIAYTPAKVYTVVQAGTNKVAVFKYPATPVGLRTTTEVFDERRQTK